MPSRRALIGLAVAAASLAAPATALGATASVSSRVLTYTAAAGEANHLEIGYQDGRVYLRDTGVSTMTAGAGCQPAGAGRVFCAPSGFDAIAADLGDGADWAANGAFFTSVTLRGGSENDQLTGGAMNDTLEGGLGNDQLSGGWGDDLLDGGGGADVMSGGAGSDRVTYAARTLPVDASIDAAANDGEAGEGDNVQLDVEKLDGGSAGDRLAGDGSRNKLVGGGGDDVLTGAGGDDALDGGEGRDGFDSGSGADRVVSRDELAESVACGSEADTVVADAFDDVAGDCESVDRSALPVVPDPTDTTGSSVTPPIGDDELPVQPPFAAISRSPIELALDGIVPVELKCPRQAFEGCKGTVTLDAWVDDGARDGTDKRRRRVRVGRRKFSVPAGKRVGVPVQLSRRNHGRLRRRRKTTVDVTVKMRNTVGTTTTTQRVTVRPSRRTCARYRGRRAVRNCRRR